MSTDCSASQSLVFPNVETLMDVVCQAEEKKKRRVQKDQLIKIQRDIQSALRRHQKEVTFTCPLLSEDIHMSDKFYDESFHLVFRCMYPSMLDAIRRAGFKIQSKEDSNNEVRFTISW